MKPRQYIDKRHQGPQRLGFNFLYFMDSFVTSWWNFPREGKQEKRYMTTYLI